ncbi:hypothetical protein PLESTB_000970100 [Pleodorina starrii]|uniref:Ankyrin repeat domain-containing protein n=1 Tax=Pleodorina starrii TaxID=330485 RepID=A0A9W6F3P9_9CHLO|nr:hypothetical protein PLESTB_000970100 [Pleodorina starrii]GLC77466.1 hypothetical protein PLESTF_001938900 [Pleodorina starrii]
MLPSPTHAFKRRWGSPNAFRSLSRLQRQKLLCLTAASGSVANLEIALDNAGLVASSELLEAAAAAGQLEVCKLLRQRGCTWGRSLLALAATGGHRHVCEWLLANGCPSRKSSAAGAARGGHEGLMYWLMERQRLQAGPAKVYRYYIGKLLRSAAAGLSLEALQRLHQQLLAGQPPPPPPPQQQQQQQGQGQAGEDEVQSAAVLDAHQKARILGAATGSPTSDWQDKVEWLERLGYPRTEHAVDSAASFASRNESHNSMGRLQWLCDRGYPPHSTAAETAMELGGVAVLHFLMEQGVVPPGGGSRAQMLAAQNGHLAVLQYLHAQGVMASPQSVSASAARGGQLHVVVWAVEALGVTPNNSPGLLDRAASSGSMEMLNWLRERGWTWGHAAVANSAEGGCEEALERLVLEQGCPLPVGTVPTRRA